MPPSTKKEYPPKLLAAATDELMKLHAALKTEIDALIEKENQYKKIKGMIVSILGERILVDGVKNMKHDNGTLFSKTLTKCQVKDKQAYSKWALENGLATVDIKPSKDEVMQYVEIKAKNLMAQSNIPIDPQTLEHYINVNESTLLPPGLKLNRFSQIQINNVKV